MSDLSKDLARVKFKKHKLPKDYKENLAKLQRILGAGLTAVTSKPELDFNNVEAASECIRATFNPTRSERTEAFQLCLVTALALEDLSNASKYKLYQDNYWCRVQSFISLSTTLKQRPNEFGRPSTKEGYSRSEEDKAIAYMQENSLSTFCKVNKEWLMTIDRNFLNNFITESEILRQIAIAGGEKS